MAELSYTMEGWLESNDDALDQFITIVEEALRYELQTDGPAAQELKKYPPRAAAKFLAAGFVDIIEQSIIQFHETGEIDSAFNPDPIVQDVSDLEV